jgi:hypothetical protein
MPHPNDLVVFVFVFCFSFSHDLALTVNRPELFSCYTAVLDAKMTEDLLRQG